MKRLLMLICFGWACGLQAQTRILTFEEAVRIALKNNILINQQRNNFELAQAQKVASIASIGPNVSANGTAQQFNGNSFNQQEARVVNGVRDQISGSIDANMNLFNGFSRINSIRSASNALDAQGYMVTRTVQDVINTVSTQYLTVLLDVELLKLAEENFEAQAKLLEQVTEQTKLGSRSPVEEYNQDAFTKGAELRMVQAEIKLDNDRALLSQTLLIDPVEPYEVEKPAWDPALIGGESLSIDSLISEAKKYRGDYLRARKSEAAARYGMAATRANLIMPSVGAFFSIGSSYNYQRGVPDSITVDGARILNPSLPRPFSEQFRTNNVYKSYGIGVSVPIFNGFRNRANVVQQKILYKNNELLTQSLEFQIRNDVVRSVRTFEGSRKAFTVTINQLEAAQKAFQLESERYNLGVTNFVDYTNANRALVQAQTDKAQAEYILVFQKIVLDYAVGTLQPEDIIQN